MVVKIRDSAFPISLLAPGRKVYVNGNPHVKTGTYEISKVGRDYFYLKGAPRSRFRISDWREDAKSGVAASVYPSQDMYERIGRIRLLVNAIREVVVGSDRAPASKWGNLSLEDLEAIAQLMGIEI